MSIQFWLKIGCDKLLLYSLEPVVGIRGFHGVRESRQLSVLKVSKSISSRWWRCLRLSILHVDHGLLHGLKHLSLHHQNLLQGQWWVGSVVVLNIVVRSIVVLSVVVALPCVDHLKDWGDKQERGRGREITVEKEILN
jgi:hypothetical protein